LFGFQYHRAEKDVAHLLLWIPKHLENNVPIFATHHCGVAGAIVAPDSNGGKILLVKEKKKDTWKLPGIPLTSTDTISVEQVASVCVVQHCLFWKLPSLILRIVCVVGGYVNLGEDFSDAAVREVFEETGVLSSFTSVLTVRHSHNIQFGRSDVYVICKMSLGRKKVHDQSDSIEKQMEITVDQEIDNAKWVPLSEFKALNKHPMLACVADILLADAPGLIETEMPSPVKNRGPFKLYHPKPL
jgi:ADP-ribose pyrophosphatase YjhB (NUDIX family)